VFVYREKPDALRPMGAFARQNRRRAKSRRITSFLAIVLDEGGKIVACPKGGQDRFGWPASGASSVNAQPGDTLSRWFRWPSKNAIVAFFNLARCSATPRTPREITT
jgi:hypothetical protein